MVIFRRRSSIDMTTALDTFTAPTGQTIRVTVFAGDPWFAAPDVCRGIGMNMAAGAHKWLVGLAADEKRLVTRADLPQLFRGSPAPSLTLISESGLYKLVLRSDKPEARAFQDWVTREVLPAGLVSP